MMHDQIEHTEHRRAADDRREPVAWSGRSTAPGAAATDATAPDGGSRP